MARAWCNRVRGAHRPVVGTARHRGREGLRLQRDSVSARMTVRGPYESRASKRTSRWTRNAGVRERVVAVAAVMGIFLAVVGLIIMSLVFR
jgi:hypothetical protein